MITPLALSHFNTYQSTDIDSVRAYVGKLFCPHSLDLASKKFQLNTRIDHAQVAGMSLVYLDYGAPVDIFPGTLDKFYLIQIVLSGRAEVSLDNKIHLAKCGEATIINPMCKTRIRATDDCRFLSIRIESARVARRLEKLINRKLDNSLIFSPKLDLCSGKGAVIGRFVAYVMAELKLQTPDSLLTSLSEQFESTLASMLLELHPHNYSSAIEGAQLLPAHHYVKKAEGYMRENLAGVITPDDLAAVADVTPRTLSNGFHRYYQTTPMGYLKSLRLDRAHESLVKAGDGETITRVAMNCGITHLGRFSHEYKLRFGESPSHTLRPK